MAEIDFIGELHSRTQRDYVARVVEHDKAACAEVAKQWGRDYWDGERQYGYGGYSYDGRWRAVADAMAAHYGLKPGNRILDIGCGKGYLLYEFTQAVSGVEVAGIDISAYAVENAKEEVKPQLRVGNCIELPYADGEFDFVCSLGTFHNLVNYDLDKALREMERVARGAKYICVESYRNEREKANLLYWQLTCESFRNTDEWKWELDRAEYSGDYGFIFFE